MKKAILIRFGEIFLKGKNYSFFENTLYKNIKWRLKDFDCNLTKTAGRFLVENFADEDLDTIIDAIKSVFGVVSLSVADEIDTSLENIVENCKKIKLVEKTFKVEVKRADKRFEIPSNKLEALLGGVILENNPNVKVDVHSPKQEVFVEIRQNGKTYIYYDKIVFK